MWCLNRLVITGPADERARFRAERGDVAHFLAGADAASAPMPSRSWCADQWGCPGEAQQVSHQHMPHVDRYTFSTPQSPPLAWCVAAAAHYVDLELHLSWENIEDECIGEARFAGGVRTAYAEMEWVEDYEADYLVPLVPGETLSHP